VRSILTLLAVSFVYAQTPDPVALLKEVQLHQHEMDEIRDNYTFHRIRRTEEVDQRGAVKKTSSIEREIFFVNGQQIGRLVKRDGVALKPSEDENEQIRVRKRVEQAMKPKADRRKSAAGLVSQMLAMATISNPRKVILNGRATLAFDFIGDRNAKAHDTMEGAAKKMSGSIWFDEADRQVAKLEIRFDDNFRIGGGLLASIQKGSNVVIEQAPVGDGLWLQTSSEEYVAARVVVKKFRQNVHVKDFDFKKFNVDAVAHPDLPR
jgi:hypothetical protein